MSKSLKLSPSIKLILQNPASDSSSAFGPGIAALCRSVRETGSLNAAAKSMGMAYSKAWRIFKETEATLGVTLLDRDGTHGSTLTPECEHILSSYEKILDDLNAQAQRETAELLG
jgi:molybdate transport system regulatory protein